jgi:branched-subunit amino acid aminotransferase/4-amino-4-deoxychorismate lyase
VTEQRRFDGATGAWIDAPPSRAAVEAAESWLVVDGRVRGLDLHWARFRAAAPELRAAVARALPVRGRWWPRVELRADGSRWLAVRPAPPREPTVVAWVSDGPDPRREPRRKGPDLERLGALRAEAARHGAGEALLSDRDGRLLEGAYSSLLWWEGDALWTVPDDAPVLPGVTRALLLALADAHQVAVRRRRPAPAELAGREVWLTGALHGIRVVSAWADGPPAGPALRASEWQRRLEAGAEPLARAAPSSAPRVTSP